MNTLSDMDVLVIGQVSTGRLEVVSDYVENRARTTATIGLDSLFSSKLRAKCVVKDSKTKCEFCLPFRNARMFASKTRNFPLFYIIELACIFICLNRLRIRFHTCLCIGPFPGIVGALLKGAGIARSSIYYSVDYFPPTTRGGVGQSVVGGVITNFDKLACLRSSITWHLSRRIAEARARFAGIEPTRYKHLTVPLGFSGRLRRSYPITQLERWSAVFVGTSGPYHGMQLLIEASSLLIATHPTFRVHIFGPSVQEATKRAIFEAGLQEHFVFEGFVENEDDLFERVAHFGVGVAPYAVLPDNPTYYTDPGKPKLYAFCGLPIIITRVPDVAEEIARAGAGVAISYDAAELAHAMEYLLEDDARLQMFKEHVSSFAMGAISEKIFDVAFDKSTDALMQP